MADIVDQATRSRMMSGISSKNTKAEVEIRKKLFSLGYRYRIHDSKLPGKPDIIMARFKAVIFIHGCFWHAHNCVLFKLPSTRRAFWKNKLKRNSQKDTENNKELKKMGWRIMTVWECSFRGAGKKREEQIDIIANKIVNWVHSSKRQIEIKG